MTTPTIGSVPSLERKVAAARRMKKQTGRDYDGASGITLSELHRRAEAMYEANAECDRLKNELMIARIRKNPSSWISRVG